MRREESATYVSPALLYLLQWLPFLACLARLFFLLVMRGWLMFHEDPQRCFLLSTIEPAVTQGQTGQVAASVTGEAL